MLCTCHPDERPAECQRKFALSECQAAAARYRCTRCGWNEFDARHYGCPVGPCPMELSRWWDRLLYKLFGIAPK